MKRLWSSIALLCMLVFGVGTLLFLAKSTTSAATTGALVQPTMSATRTSTPTLIPTPAPFAAELIPLIDHAEMEELLHGSSVLVAENFSHAGYPDLIIAAENTIKQFVYRTDSEEYTFSSGNWQYSLSEYKGGRIAMTTGDFDQDDLPDLVIGLPDYTSMNTATESAEDSEHRWGAVLIFFGTGEDFSELPRKPDITIISSEMKSDFGYTVSVGNAACENDSGAIDDDIFLIVGAPGAERGEVQEGAVLIYSGQTLAKLKQGVVDQGQQEVDWWQHATWRAEGDENSSRFGSALANAGDVNGDCFDDVLVGAPGFDHERGAAYLFFGSTDMLDSEIPETGTSMYDWRDMGAHPGERFGIAVSGIGNLYYDYGNDDDHYDYGFDDDYYDDFIVGSDRYSNGESYKGRVVLYDGWVSERILRVGQIELDMSNIGPGVALGGSGDLDNNEKIDLIVSATTRDSQGRGSVYIFLNALDHFREGSNEADMVVTEEQAGSHFGVALASTEIDGCDAIIVGAPSYRYEDDGKEIGQVFLYYSADCR